MQYFCLRLRYIDPLLSVYFIMGRYSWNSNHAFPSNDLPAIPKLLCERRLKTPRLLFDYPMKAHRSNIQGTDLMTGNNTRRATILLWSVAAVVLATSAFARPAHHRHRIAQATPVASQMMGGADRDARYPANVERTAMQSAGEYVGQTRRHVGRSIGSAYARAQSHANSAYGGPTSNALVTEARKYIGTNPTGRASLWCGTFMDMVLKRTGHPGGANLASAYTRYGTRVAGP
jgi:hypothetical protein